MRATLQRELAQLRAALREIADACDQLAAAGRVTTAEELRRSVEGAGELAWVMEILRQPCFAQCASPDAVLARAGQAAGAGRATGAGQATQNGSERSGPASRRRRSGQGV